MRRSQRELPGHKIEGSVRPLAIFPRVSNQIILPNGSLPSGVGECITDGHLFLDALMVLRKVPCEPGVNPMTDVGHEQDLNSDRDH